MTIPVILFAYSRPEHLIRTLESLRINQVPLIHAFCDGPKTADLISKVDAVREILRSIDWAEVVLTERQENRGLGRSILSGVGDVLKSHDMILVWEDDLICVPGTYEYLCEALRKYKDDNLVMSVTGWTHPRVIPSDVTDQPYFDGRSECLVWGTWARSWTDMKQDARTLMNKCVDAGIDVNRYGADLPAMAKIELKRNVWAVRWTYAHILRRGLCLRPPHSLVEHIGFDESATNASDGSVWSNPVLKPCPPVPAQWPVPVEHPECAPLWRAAYGSNSFERFFKRARRLPWKLRLWQHQLSRKMRPSTT